MLSRRRHRQRRHHKGKSDHDRRLSLLNGRRLQPDADDRDGVPPTYAERDEPSADEILARSFGVWGRQPRKLPVRRRSSPGRLLIWDAAFSKKLACLIGHRLWRIGQVSPCLRSLPCTNRWKPAWIWNVSKTDRETGWPTTSLYDLAEVGGEQIPQRRDLTGKNRWQRILNSYRGKRPALRKRPAEGRGAGAAELQRKVRLNSRHAKVRGRRVVSVVASRGTIRGIRALSQLPRKS